MVEAILERQQVLQAPAGDAGFWRSIDKARRAARQEGSRSALLVIHTPTPTGTDSSLGRSSSKAARAAVELGILDRNRLGILWKELDPGAFRRLSRQSSDLDGEENGTPVRLAVFSASSNGAAPFALLGSPLDGGDAEEANRELVAEVAEDPARGLPLWKRALDICVASLTLAALSPLMLLIALGIKWVDPGPVLFTQDRIGYRGKTFKVIKFRSMRTNIPTESHRNHFRELMQSGRQMFKLDAHDPRLIPLGQFMRATALDELPQLFNVVRGDMSLVGPRPSIPYEYEAYEPWQKLRTLAVPGMTGLWQVSGKNKTTFNEMVALDIRYALTKSMMTDLRIICSTPKVLIEQVLETIHGKGKST